MRAENENLGLSGTTPLPQRNTETTTIELECVGNFGNGYINAQCSVSWFEVSVNDDKNELDCIQHDLPMRDYRRKARINYCRYEIPAGVICCYRRAIQTNPRTEESKWFRVDGGQCAILGDIIGGTSSFIEKFLSSYIERGYKCTSRSGPYPEHWNKPVRIE
jgi:hypothetical protein